jgi:tetratricopeptide (TPR) repeat protein
MPELPPMPAMPEVAAMPELPPMPAMPELPPMPAMPEVAVMQPAVVAMPVMPESVQADMGSVLEDARRAFQAGNLDEAEAKYRAILSTSESPDAYGELGNIFFSRRQFNDANDAYLKAAEGLIAQNRLLQAQYVIGVLMNTQPEYAQQAMQAFNAKLHNAR